MTDGTVIEGTAEKIAELQKLLGDKNSAKPKCKTEDRPAKVGERILITKKFPFEIRYDNGDIYEVKEERPGGGVRAKTKEGRTVFVFRDEYEVIIEEENGDKLKVYDARGNEIKEGDRVKLQVKGEPRHGWGDVSNGEIGTVINITDEKEVVVNFPSDFHWYALPNELINLSAEPRAEFEGVKKVRLIAGGGRFPLFGFKNGKIYEVKDVFTIIHGGKRIEIIDEDRNTGYALPSQLEFVECDEDSTEKFEVGDYAKVTGLTLFSDITEGSYVKIVEDIDSDDEYEIILIDDSNYDYAKPEALEKVELTNRDLTFIKAGRKPGEFKVGDLAEVIDYHDTFPKNTVVEIAKKYSDGDVLAKRSEEIISHLTKPEHLKLIAPIEARVDR